MSKVIKFKTDYRLTPEYRRELNLSVNKLDEFGNELIGLMINLATTGKWKEWSDNMQDGVKFEFSEEMLKDTGDENVNDLALMMDELSRINARLHDRLTNLD